MIRLLISLAFGIRAHSLAAHDPPFNYYIVTPRQGRHTIRRKLLRALPARFSQHIQQHR